MIDLVPLIQAAGAIQIGIVVGNAAIPRRLAVRQHITWLSPILRQVFLVHWLYILIVLGIFGGLSVFYAPDLAGGTGLGRALSGCLAVFWGLRLLIQVFYYDPGGEAPVPARRRPLHAGRRVPRGRLRRCGARSGAMVIELLFLTAPLLAVPMAMTLAARLDRDLEASLFFRAAAALRIPAAILTAASFLPAAGVVAGTLAAPWALVTILVALSSVARFARGRPLPLDGLVALAGHLYLPVGGIFLVQSRAGIRPMGFLEPIVILTAVHFHFSGFVAPILASATGRALRSRGERARSLFAIVAVGVIGAPAVLAAGWMTSSPILKLTGAVSLALCHGGLALLTLSTLRDLRPKGAGWLVAISSLSLMTAMLLAAAYAIAEYRERPVLTIPFMAAAHGMLLVFGFSLCGLAGRQMEERHF